MISLPEDIQKCIREDNWVEYAALCRRYNLLPTDKYNSKIEDFGFFYENCKDPHGIYISEPKKLIDLRILDTIYLKDISYITVNIKSDNIIMGKLSNLSFPNLVYLTIDVGRGGLTNLGYLSSDSLLDLEISGNVGKDLSKISLKELRHLKIWSWDQIDLGFLNHSDMVELTNLTLKSSTFYTHNLDIIDWSKYKYLKQLHLSEEGNKYKPNTFLLTNTLECLENITHLCISKGASEVIGSVSIPSLYSLRLEVNSVLDLKGLNTPNLEYLNILTYTKEDMYGGLSILRSIFGERIRVSIGYLSKK